MLRLITRRFLQMFPLLLGITLISFGVMQLAPGDYLTEMRANPNVRPETIARLRRDFGLDKPLFFNVEAARKEGPRALFNAQYPLWLGNALQGNWGFSFRYKIGAFELIGQRLYYTFLLSFWSTVFSWCVAIPLGVYIATHRNSLPDRLANLLAFAGISMPGFFFALLLLLLAASTGWFPIGGASSVGYETMSRSGKILDTARHLFLPVLVLGTGGVASLMRQTRGSLLDVLSENFIMAGRARGLSERVVVLKHGVRNAVNPLITLFGFELAGLLGGAALVENVMDWPGLGQLLLEAVQSKDLYVAMGAFVMGAVLLIAGNLVADLLLALTDPRIKLG